MGQEIKVTGLVLQTGNIGEYDRRIVLLTKERGRISAFARGAKKATSSYAAACQPFTFGTFSLYEGKSSFNLMWAQVDNYFEDLKKDLDLIYYASYFCELASYLTRENNDELEILKLVYQSLRALEKKTIPPELIRCVFEIKVLALYGLGMEVFHCVRCGNTEDLTGMMIKEGGCVCKNCDAGALPVGTSTLYALQFIMYSSIEKLYTFRVNDEVLAQLQKIIKEFMRMHISHSFKSLVFLS
jgi:DNA repair protein RecO (recombination protein O)